MSNEQCSCHTMAGSWNEERTRIFEKTGHHYDCEKLDHSLKPYYKVALYRNTLSLLLGNPDTHFVVSAYGMEKTLNELCDGGSYVITRVMMSDVDFQCLPEFQGF